MAQPERLTMRSPDGTQHMVLAQDRERFEAEGYELMGTFAGTPLDEYDDPSGEADEPGEESESVDASAFVQPDKQPRTRKPKPA